MKLPEEDEKLVQLTPETAQSLPVHARLHLLTSVLNQLAGDPYDATMYAAVLTLYLARECPDRVKILERLKHPKEFLDREETRFAARHGDEKSDTEASAEEPHLEAEFTHEELLRLRALIDKLPKVPS